MGSQEGLLEDVTTQGNPGGKKEAAHMQRRASSHVGTHRLDFVLEEKRTGENVLCWPFMKALN